MKITIMNHVGDTYQTYYSVKLLFVARITVLVYSPM